MRCLILAFLANCSRAPSTSSASPTAAIDAAAGATVGQPWSISGARSAATSEGEPLAYYWTFSDGTRAGTVHTSHVFTTPGAHYAELTVTTPNGASATSRADVQVAAGPEPTGTSALRVRVLDTHGNVVAGASVTNTRTLAVAITGVDGVAVLDVGLGAPEVLHVNAAGMTRQIKRLNLSATLSNGEIDIVVRFKPSPVFFNADEGGTARGEAGATLVLPPHAFVTQDGASVTGQVAVTMAPIDVVNDTFAFPGDFRGIADDANLGLLMSAGTVDFSFEQAGQRVALAPLQTAVVEIPSFASTDDAGQPWKEGRRVPLWSLDERTGLWIQEGDGAIVASPQSSTGFALRAEVTHFSWWNMDQFQFPPRKKGGNCCIDSNFDGACDGPSMCYVRGRSNCASPPCSARREVGGPPRFAATDVIASGEDKVFDLPAAYAVRFDGFAQGGTLTGHYDSNPDDDPALPFTLVLQPIPIVKPDTVLVLPFDSDFTSGEVGAVSTALFDATAGDLLFLEVSRTPGSMLGGTLKVLGPGGAVLGSAVFGAQTGAITLSIPSSGRYRIEIDPNAGEPGGYHLHGERLDASLPYVLSFAPPPGATGFAGVTGAITFAHPLKTVPSLSRIRVLGPTEAALLSSPAFDGADHTRVLLDLAGATPATTYEIRVGGGTSGVQSVSGTTLPGDVVSYFTTAEPFGVITGAVGPHYFGGEERAITAWAEAGPVPQPIWTASYNLGVGWNWPVRLDAPHTGTITTVNIAVAGARSMVVWSRSEDGKWFSNAHDGVAFGAATEIPIVGAPLSSKLLMDAAGRALFVYETSGSAGHFHRYLGGPSGWLAAEDYPHSTFEVLGGVMSPSGQAIQLVSDGANIKLSRFSFASGFTVDATIDPTNQASIGVDDGGHFFVGHAGGASAYVVERYNGATWDARDALTSGYVPSSGAITVSANGDAYAVFHAQDTGVSPFDNRLQAARFDKGAVTWGTPVTLHQASANSYSFTSRITSDAAGHPAVVFKGSDTSNVMYTSGAANTWTTPSSVGAETAISGTFSGSRQGGVLFCPTQGCYRLR